MARRLILLLVLNIIYRNQAISCSGDCSCPTSAPSNSQCILKLTTIYSLLYTHDIFALIFNSCRGDNQCKDAHLQCNDNECTVNCIEKQACAGNSVIYGGAGDLTVICDGMIHTDNGK